jgi:hypothetical protein
MDFFHTEKNDPDFNNYLPLMNVILVRILQKKPGNIPSLTFFLVTTVYLGYFKEYEYTTIHQ